MARAYGTPGHRGNILLNVVFVLLGLGLASGVLYIFHSLTSKQLRIRNLTSEVEVAAENLARIMGERLVAAAEWYLGVITQEVIDSLNAEVASITLPDGINVIAESTGYYVTRIGVGEPVPYDAEPIRVVSDHPRAGHTTPVVTDGMRSSHAIEVEVVARVMRKNARGSATATYRIEKLMPHQFAIYTDGDAELCVGSGKSLVVGGSVRIDGALFMECDGDHVIAGDVYVRQAIDIGGFGDHLVVVAENDLRQLTDLNRANVYGAAGSVLATWNGRVRLAGGLAARLTETMFQTAAIPGSGACLDGMRACSGIGAFLPSVQIQRTTQGAGGEYDLRCGWAYGEESCAAVGEAIVYWPYPFADLANPDTARMDPSSSDLLWRGLFPDYRRETRCTAAFPNGPSFRTFRCITNPFGFVLDGSRLPPIPGGVLHVQRWNNPPAGMNPFQEVLLIKNAEELAGPLTIVSEIPVVLQGSFNTVAPKPAMIDAPLISVLPAEAAQQLASSSIWDSTSVTPHTMLAAYTPIRIRAVLRAKYHRSEGGQYWGGLAEQIPAVVGDFSGTTVEVVGAVEGRQEPPYLADAYAQWHAPYGSEPSGMQIKQPAGRRILYAPDLRAPEAQPFGSWHWTNIPPAGVFTTRTQERQKRANGGITVVRRIREVRVVSEVAELAPVALPEWTDPAAPTADFTVGENVPVPGSITLDGTGSEDSDGTIVEWHWNLGDGTVARGAQVVHEYARTGTYQVTLTVVDDDGLVAMKTKTVTVTVLVP